jgi:hypothetical protein
MSRYTLSPLRVTNDPLQIVGSLGATGKGLGPGLRDDLDRTGCDFCDEPVIVSLTTIRNGEK